MAEEKVLDIFRRAGATDAELDLVRKGLKMWREGAMTSDELYFYLVGIARELLIPLTPKMVGDLREALGLPRSFEIT